MNFMQDGKMPSKCISAKAEQKTIYYQCHVRCVHGIFFGLYIECTESGILGQCIAYNSVIFVGSGNY